MLDAIEAGADPCSYERELRQWVHTLGVRTRHLRDGFTDTVGAILDEMTHSADCEDARQAAWAYVEANLDETIIEALAQLPKEQRDYIVSVLQQDPGKWADLRDRARHLASQLDFGKAFKELLPVVGQRAQLDDAAKNGQVRGLSKLLTTSGRENPIVVDSWHVFRTDSTPFVLGDCCIFGVDESSSVHPLLAESEKRREIYVPVSMQCVAVGLRERATPSLTPSEINLAMARVSRDTLFASSLDASVVALSTEIGTSSSFLGKESVNVFVRRLWRDMRENPRDEKKRCR